MGGPLTDRTALVTGGTRGIGAAIARRLVEAGARVTVTGRAPDGTGPAGCLYRPVDFSNTEAAEAFAGEVAGRGFDVLINNAGTNTIAPFDQIESNDFDTIHRINVRAPFLLCRAAVPSMRQRAWGRIVNIASILGVISKAQRGAYSTSKFALDGMTAALAAEVAAEGILANCVSPGFIETDLTKRVLGPKAMADLTAVIPIRRLGTPDEVAALVLWLAGPENTYVSGQNFVIDGGFSRV